MSLLRRSSARRESVMFQTRTEAANAAGVLTLRMAVGGMMLTHGVPKLIRLVQTPGQFADPLGLGPELSLVLAVFAEVVCAVLILFGAATRAAAIPILITMVVAAFIVHGADPFAKKELALLYGAGALTLTLTGAGRFSIDALIDKRRRRSRASE
jgi:putative oxidoreductase